MKKIISKRHAWKRKRRGNTAKKETNNTKFQKTKANLTMLNAQILSRSS